jgi:cytochrome P450
VRKYLTGLVAGLERTRWPGFRVTSPNPRENRSRYAIGGPSVWNVTDAVELVLLDEDSYCQHPAGFFARLCESRPVAPVWMRDYGRVWIITRYADVRAALTDSRLANKGLPLAGRRPVLPG